MNTLKLLVASAMLISLSACGGANVQSTTKTVITRIYDGDYDGDTVTRTLALRNFDALRVSGAAKVTYHQSPTYRVTMTTSPEYIDCLNFKVKDGVLSVDWNNDNRNNWRIKHYVAIEIWAPKLVNISNSGVLKFSATKLAATEVKIECSGAGTFNLGAVECDKFDLYDSGIVTLTAGNISADECQLTVDGVSHVNAKFRGGKLTVVGNGQGDMDLDVDCKEVDTQIDGVLNVDLSGMADKTNISGGGVAKVNTSKLNQY